MAVLWLFRLSLLAVVHLLRHHLLEPHRWIHHQLRLNHPVSLLFGGGLCLLGLRLLTSMLRLVGLVCWLAGGLHGRLILQLDCLVVGLVLL